MVWAEALEPAAGPGSSGEATGASGLAARAERQRRGWRLTLGEAWS